MRLLPGSVSAAELSTELRVKSMFYTGSEMKVIAVIQETEEIRYILAHLVKIAGGGAPSRRPATADVGRFKRSDLLIGKPIFRR